MSRISSNILADTLNIVQIARETALQNGKKAQAERLDSVAGSLKTLVKETQETNRPAAPSGIMGQSDFRALLEAANGGSRSNTNYAQSSAVERNKVVSAMAESGMTELDIARQMGMTREEVKLIVNVNQKAH